MQEQFAPFNKAAEAVSSDIQQARHLIDWMCRSHPEVVGASPEAKMIAIATLAAAIGAERRHVPEDPADEDSPEAE